MPLHLLELRTGYGIENQTESTFENNYLCLNIPTWPSSVRIIIKPTGRSQRFCALLCGTDTSKAAFNVLAPFVLFILLFSCLSMFQDRCQAEPNSNGTAAQALRVGVGLVVVARWCNSCFDLVPISSRKIVQCLWGKVKLKNREKENKKNTRRLQTEIEAARDAS